MNNVKLRPIEVMKRSDGTGFGVMVPGLSRFVCQLPEGYDPMRMKMALYDGMVLIVQDEKPPLCCNPYTGEVAIREVSDGQLIIH